MGERGQVAVRLDGVGKTYGQGSIAVHALRGVSLDVVRGEFVVVLGPSGSGKTTLLNVIGAIEPATRGRVVVEGVDLATLDERGRTAFRRERAGFIFQFFNLIPTLTARENVQLVLELTGRTVNDSVLDEVLARVGLAERAGHFPAQLSGGEQQRVAIARAIAKDPPILFCDEPTGALDLDTGRHVLSLLREVSTGERRTVLLVTHNSAIARVADRVIRMRSGVLVSDELVEQPPDPNDLEW